MTEAPRFVADLPGFHAQRTPTEVALEFRGRSLTWSAFDNLVGRTAAGLVRDGVQPGGRVAYLGRNSDIMLALFFAAARIGAVFVPLNWRLAAPEIDYILNDSGANLIFVEAAHRAVVSGDLPVVTMIQGAPEQGLASWLPHSGVRARVPQSSDTVVQLYTSGTTGRPKGALLSDAYFVGGARMFLSHPEMALRLRPSEFAPVTMPMFHVGGLNFCYVIASQGRGLIILEDYDPVELLHLINDGRIALATGVPTMLQGLIEHPAARDTDFSSLRHYAYGAAPMPPTLLRRAIEVMGCGFASMYGMTEASGVTYLAPSDHDASERMRSVGRPLPGVELRIVDPQGQPLPPGEVGEIAIASPQLLSGYWRLPDATREAFADGFFKTGDAAYQDEEGYVFLKDRIKDMIISGGENIYPAEVEFVLVAHPSVHEVAVVGVPDPRWGEIPKAFIVAAPDASVVFEDLQAFAAERLARYKVPKQFELIDALPRNASGKVLKRELRERRLVA